MASVLGVTATSYSCQDVSELMKQIKMEEANRSQVSKPVQNVRISSSQDSNSTSPNTRLNRMVQQVKEVLPQVPSTAIARDLSES